MAIRWNSNNHPVLFQFISVLLIIISLPLLAIVASPLGFVIIFLVGLIWRYRHQEEFA